MYFHLLIMCFLFVPFFMPFPLFPNFPYFSAGNLASYFTEKKSSSQRRTSTSSLMTSGHVAASEPIYSAVSSIEDKLFILLAKAKHLPQPPSLCTKSHPFLPSQWCCSLSILHHQPFVLYGLFSISIGIPFSPILQNSCLRTLLPPSATIPFLHFTAKLLRTAVYSCCLQSLFSHSLNQLPWVKLAMTFTF